MSQIRVTRFTRSTRYSVLVPNEQPFDCKIIGRVTRRPKKKGQPVQLPLPWEQRQ